MINPIHDQAYQEYTRISHQKPIDTQEKFSMDAAMHENASADAAANGVIYEPGKASESDSAQNAATNAKNTASRTGSVSAATEKTARTTMGQHTASANNTSITDTVKRFVQNMLQTVKKVLSAIWESKPAEGNAVADDADRSDIIDPNNADSANMADLHAESSANIVDQANAGNPESSVSYHTEALPPSESTASYYTGTLPAADVSDAEIKKALKAGDADTFRALLSQDGKRIPARSSSLLTYYDATGKLVNIDPSEQHRILHGDRGSQRS